MGEGEAEVGAETEATAAAACAADWPRVRLRAVRGQPLPRLWEWGVRCEDFAV